MAVLLSFGYCDEYSFLSTLISSTVLQRAVSLSSRTCPSRDSTSFTAPVPKLPLPISSVNSNQDLKLVLDQIPILPLDLLRLHLTPLLLPLHKRRMKVLQKRIVIPSIVFRGCVRNCSLSWVVEAKVEVV